MPYTLNEKLAAMQPYDAICGSYRIRLDANESFLDPGERFREELQRSLGEIPLNRYPDPSCMELRESFGRAYGVDPDLVVAGNGSDELLSLLMGAFMKRGETLLTLSPDFSMYRFYGDTYERDQVVLEKRDLVIEPREVLAAMRESGARVLLFSNPASPVSTVLPREKVLEIVTAAEGLVVVDEAYMDFADESVMDMAGTLDNLLVLKTCSKAWGMAGLRLGFAISSPAIVKALNSIRSPYNLNAYTQAAGRVILSHPEYLKEAREAMIAGRDRLYEGLQPLEAAGRISRIEKSQTNFLYVECPDSEAIFQELLKRSIIVRKLGGALRITAGSPEENEALLKAMYEILEGVA